MLADWAAWLAEEDAVTTTRVRQRTHTGRPLGSPEFLTHLEALLERPVTPNKRGPKAKGKIK